MSARLARLVPSNTSALSRAHHLFPPRPLARSLCPSRRTLGQSSTRRLSPSSLPRGLQAAPRPHQRNTSRKPLQSSSSATALLAGLAFALGVCYLLERHSTDDVAGEQDLTDSEKAVPLSSDDDEMPIASAHSSAILPGRPGNLTPEQDAKLRELWARLGHLIGVEMEANGMENPYDDTASTAPSSTPRTSGRFARFGRGKEAVDENDKHDSNKEFRRAIEEMSQAELRSALWDFSKCDDPDSNLCRYLRARKWNVHDALVMLISTIHWRKTTMHLDDDVMINGEEAAMRTLHGETTGTGGMSKKMAHDILDQLRMGKSFIHGVDRQGRPLCFVRVKLHRGGEHSPESLERVTVYVIETARFMLDSPRLETATLVFDMSGFSMANMDYAPVKFLIKVFEANYPESLGAVIVYKAPWIFQSVWNIIKGWLDPVVASKISFAKESTDLAKYIEPGNIPREMGGDEDWTYTYPEPVDGENAIMADVATRDRLQHERAGILDQFEAATAEWVKANGVDDAHLREKRQRIAKTMNDNYWQLDPYVRSRSSLDREGVILPGGKIEPYPKQPPQWPPTAPTAPAVAPHKAAGGSVVAQRSTAPLPSSEEGTTTTNSTTSPHSHPTNGLPPSAAITNGTYVRPIGPSRPPASTPSTAAQAAPDQPRQYPAGVAKPFQRQTNGIGLPSWNPPVSGKGVWDAQSGNSVYYDARDDLD